MSSRSWTSKTNTDLVFAKGTLDKNKTLIIGYMHRPPSSCTQYTEDLCITTEGIGQRYKNAVIFIDGDLNLPGINCRQSIHPQFQATSPLILLARV